MPKVVITAKDLATHKQYIPVVGKLNSATGADVKGIFIYKNSVLNQVYPPIHQITFSSSNLESANNGISYIAIGITGTTDGWKTVDGSILPTSVTVKFDYWVTSASSYGGWEYNIYSSSGTCSSGYSSGELVQYADDVDITSFSDGTYYQFYTSGSNYYYIYIVGKAESSYVQQPTFSYACHDIDIKWDTKYVSYVGNIYAQKNLFNFTYSNYNYWTSNIYSWGSVNFPTANGSKQAYFTVYPSSFNTTVLTSNIGTYNSRTGKSKVKLFLSPSSITIPDIGHSIISYDSNITKSTFGYNFAGYFSINAQIPFNGDPVVPSSGSLFDYNPTTNVSRYKIDSLYGNGWETARNTLMYSWIWSTATGGTTQYLCSGYSPNEDENDHSGDTYRFIILSTESSINLVISGNPDGFSAGTYTINRSNVFSKVADFGWSSGGATPNLQTPFYNLPVSTSPWTGVAYALTNSKYNYFTIYSGPQGITNNIINYIYGSTTVYLQITDEGFENNYKWSIGNYISRPLSSGFDNYYGLSTRTSPIYPTIYVYYFGCSASDNRYIRFYGKQIGSFTPSYNPCKFNYVIQSKTY